ncbi:hypothetical protein GS399_05260 [Pedobacter sp. HMF7647]|uniref:DUF6443 domain-containing protein n=1 Tax=Hufsiella arboris TaxID=2695275 RepID=A0A7K1Y725_9SPHI|nr:DUF6443 domain-containing protein [Hufsiella arboris]MXV50373.1 hypothetical protein [Hufsiella arboris]
MINYLPARFVLLVLLVNATVFAAMAQTPSYVQQDVIQVPGVLTEAQAISLPQSSKRTTKNYFDGLGRVIQTVNVQASPTLKDMVTPYSYDNMGRPAKNLLPYSAADGSGNYRASSVTEQNTFYSNGSGDKVADDQSPFSQQVFENSPLQRLMKEGNVGAGFQTASGQHYKSVSYRSNTASDNVLNWSPTGTMDGNYAAGALSVVDVKDEQGIETLNFTDIDGHIVLKRQLANETVNGVLQAYFDTYYIYNNAGLIRYVVQPKAVSAMKASSNFNLLQAGTDKMIFRYEYDQKGRLVEKYIPGKVAIYIIYDPLNRPVLIQDGNLRSSNKWNYIKYDTKGRAISQGIYTNASYTSRTSMQSFVNSQDYSTNYFEERSSGVSNGYYTNVSFPTSGIEPLAYSYYEDYDLDANGTADYAYQAQGLAGESVATAQTRGMLTMIRKRTIGSSLGNSWLFTAIFYDKNGRLIQQLTNNQLNAQVNDSKTFVPDFVGKTIQLKVSKVVSSGTTVVLSSYIYDHYNRLLAIDQNYNNSSTPLRLAAYEYNELGQLVKRNLNQLSSASIVANLELGSAESVNASSQRNSVASNSIVLKPGFYAAAGSIFTAKIATNYLQAVDYRYNVRGQLTSINNSSLTVDSRNDDTNDVFGMELLYDQADASLGNTSLYNGQLSAVKWRAIGSMTPNPQERSYRYDYDQLNRLKNAIYADRAVGGAWSNAGAFDEKNMSYDENGNILGLQRNAKIGSNVTAIDDLSYSYDGNGLYNVTDAGSSASGFKNNTGSTGAYSYDANGNLQVDPKKGISLEFNELNRTQKITVTTGVGRYLTYAYDAGGVLLRKQTYDNNLLQKTTDYVDGFVYENSTLAYFPTPEGRVRNVSGSLKNEYMIADQQGNVRVSFEEQNGAAVVRQENSYYAFGLIMPGGSTPSDPNRNLYNAGSEWQNDFADLPDYYQTYYRNYDAALGRWTGVDPLADLAENWSPYQYANDNPIGYNDPNGDISQALWEAALREANNPGGSGGYFSDATGAQYYGSGADALTGGAGYMLDHGLYGRQPGWAVNYSQAVQNYNISTGSNIKYDGSGYATSALWYRDNSGNATSIKGNSAMVNVVQVDKAGNGGPEGESFLSKNWKDMGFLAADLARNFVNKNTTYAISEGYNLARTTVFIGSLTTRASTKLLGLVSKTATGAARIAPWVAGGTILIDAVANKQINAGQVYQAAITGLSIIPGAGLIVGGGALLLEGASYLYNGKSVSDNINLSLDGGVIYSWK